MIWESYIKSCCEIPIFSHKLSLHKTTNRVFVAPKNHVTNFVEIEYGRLPSLVVRQFQLTAIIRPSLHEDITGFPLYIPNTTSEIS
jgi:hypothetical protein